MMYYTKMYKVDYDFIYKYIIYCILCKIIDLNI